MTQVLLSGDTILPKDDDAMLPLLGYALELTAYAANTQKLRCVDTTREFIRFSTMGDNPEEFIRRAELPVSDSDEIDIDEGLIYAVARFIAYAASTEKYNFHYSAAMDMITKYNESIIAHLED